MTPVGMVAFFVSSNKVRDLKLSSIGRAMGKQPLAKPTDSGRLATLVFDQVFQSLYKRRYRQGNPLRTEAPTNPETNALAEGNVEHGGLTKDLSWGAFQGILLDGSA
jgi:hypothetical protein